MEITELLQNLNNRISVLEKRVEANKVATIDLIDSTKDALKSISAFMKELNEYAIRNRFIKEINEQ